MLNKNRLPDTDFRAAEHWTSDTKEEILKEFDQMLMLYPESKYGSMLAHVRQDPTGMIWHANFSRRNIAQ